jgi:hypothetical protein
MLAGRWQCAAASSSSSSTFAITGATATQLGQQQRQQPNANLVLMALQLCHEAVGSIGSNLHILHSTGVAAVSLQQLQQQCAALLPMLGPFPTEQLDDPHAPLTLLRSLQASGTLQQVVRFAGAVAGQLPLRWGCNNPGCTSLEKRSEVLLVAGKSCVCGACRAAR